MIFVVIFVFAFIEFGTNANITSVRKNGRKHEIKNNNNNNGDGEEMTTDEQNEEVVEEETLSGKVFA